MSGTGRPVPDAATPIRFAPRNIHVYIASACNLACTYCWNQGGTFGAAVGKVMSETTARATLSWVEGLVREQRPAGLSFSFFGGEPLLNPAVLRFLVAGLLEIRRRRRLDLRLLIFTNGTLVDPALVDAIAGKPFVEYHIGLDGDRQRHDLYRIGRDGRGSYDRVAETIRDLQRRGVFVAAESVVLPPYDYAGLLAAYGELGIPYAYVQEEILPVSGSCPLGDRTPRMNLERWTAAYRAFTELYFDRLLERSAPLVDPLFGVVKWFLPATEEAGLACTTGTGQIAIAADGRIQACNLLLNEAAYALGDVFDGLDAERFRAFGRHLLADGRVVDRNPRCQACAIRALCKGGCYAKNLAATGDIGRIESDEICRFRCRRAAIQWAFVERMVDTFPTYVEDVRNRNYAPYFPQLSPVTES